MAIKISNTTVIDNSRNLNNIAGADATTISNLGSSMTTGVIEGLMTTNTIAAGTVGRAQISSHSNQFNSSNNANGFDWAMMQKGTVRISYNVKPEQPGTTAHSWVMRWRRGAWTTLYQYNATNNASYSSNSVDVSVLPGDIVGFRIYGDNYSQGKNNVGSDAQATNIQLGTTSTTYYIPGNYNNSIVDQSV